MALDEIVRCRWEIQGLITEKKFTMSSEPVHTNTLAFWSSYTRIKHSLYNMAQRISCPCRDMRVVETQRYLKAFPNILWSSVVRASLFCSFNKFTRSFFYKYHSHSLSSEINLMAKLMSNVLSGLSPHKRPCRWSPGCHRHRSCRQWYLSRQLLAWRHTAHYWSRSGSRSAAHRGTQGLKMNS